MSETLRSTQEVGIKLRAIDRHFKKMSSENITFFEFTSRYHALMILAADFNTPVMELADKLQFFKTQIDK